MEQSMAVHAHEAALTSCFLCVSTVVSVIPGRIQAEEFDVRYSTWVALLDRFRE